MREADVKLPIRVLIMRNYKCDDILKMVTSYLAEKVAFSGRFGHNERRENARDENDAVCKVQESAIFKVQCIIVIVNISMTYTEG